MPIRSPSAPPRRVVTERPEGADPLAPLVRRARSGDDGAFDRLAGAVRGEVRRWALVRTGDPDDAEDVTQEVLLRLHRALPEFEGRSRVTNWLFRVARNAAADLLRARRSRVRAHEAAAGDAVRGPSSLDVRLAALDDERAAALVRAFFAELPARQREVFDMVDLRGMEPIEAARALGVAPATARVHLLRARRTIRARILETNPALAEDR